jgi:hypothetical protein
MLIHLHTSAYKYINMFMYIPIYLDICMWGHICIIMYSFIFIYTFIYALQVQLMVLVKTHWSSVNTHAFGGEIGIKDINKEKKINILASLAGSVVILNRIPASLAASAIILNQSLHFLDYSSIFLQFPYVTNVIDEDLNTSVSAFEFVRNWLLKIEDFRWSI